MLDTLIDWTIRTNLDICGKMLSSKSQVELFIYKLTDYINNIDIQNNQFYQEAREKGLRPRQMRYFFRSYEPHEARRAEYGFLDQIRINFERLDPTYRTIGDRPAGWLDKKKLDWHLKRLVELHALVKVDGRYKRGDGPYYLPSLPHFYKNMVNGIPSNWMTPHAGNGASLLIHLEERGRLIKEMPPRATDKGSSLEGVQHTLEVNEMRLESMDEEMLAACNDFILKLREIHKRHMGEDRERTWESHFECWGSMPLVLIDPRPPLEQVPRKRRNSL